MKKSLIITGGAGFIGSNLVRKALATGKWKVANIDNLTYSGNLASLKDVENHPDYRFIKADIAEGPAMEAIFEEIAPDAVINLAAESHVDRSIDSPGPFVQTNIVGVYSLLEAARKHWKRTLETNPEKAGSFRFLHVSTDEVFGDLEDEANGFFSESTPYRPSSPYSASKAASDHLVRAWQRTYGLPTLVTNCSNNYGPRQFPEKLIPLTIINALKGKPLPVYGKGAQIRDWLFVDDHAEALLLALEEGSPGETYVIGGHNEKKNIEIVKAICEVLERLAPQKPAGVNRYADLITFVADRPGHDARYAIDPAKITRELGWKPAETFDTGLEKTVRWYLENPAWWQEILDSRYDGRRLGTNI